MDKIVFLDRDGTINYDEFGYINKPDDLKLYSFSGKAIKTLNQAGFKIIVVTNQSGIARGYFTMDDLKAIHEKLTFELDKDGASIDKIYISPYHKDGHIEPYNIDSDCRKPKPGMFFQAKKDFLFKPSECYMIGDKMSDIRFGHQFGMTTILVLSGEGHKTLEKRKKWTVQPDFIAENLLSASDLILLLEKQKNQSTKSG